MKKFRLYIITFLALVAVVLCMRACNSEPQTEHNNVQIPSISLQSEIPDCEEVTIRYVVDGDTLAVTDSQGQEYKVRLIGCDTPESVSSDESRNCEEGKLASQYTKSLLSQGDTIYLEYDMVHTDKYKRTLAYVWLSEPTQSADKTYMQKYMLNAKLLAGGQAKSMFVGQNIKYKTEFLEIEKDAQSKNKGFWQNNSFLQMIYFYLV